MSALHTDPSHVYTSDCPGCRPVILDTRTGQPLGADDPVMVAINAIWDGDCTLEEKRACIRVWVHNSRAEGDLTLVEKVARRFESAVVCTDCKPS